MQISLERVRKLIDSFDPAEVTLKSTSRTHVFKVKISGDRRILLKNIYNRLEKSNFTVELVNHSWLSRSSGHVKIGSIYIISKPLIGATENLGIYTSKLTDQGQKENLNLLGFSNISCNVFYDSDALMDSVISCLREIKIPKSITGTLEKYFENLENSPGNFSWSKGVKESDKNELGKYFGEVLLGILNFSGVLGDISDNEKFIQLVDNPKKLIYPVSSNFKIIDAAIQKNKNTICISNKFGKGAAASFFSNILPYTKKMKGCRELNRIHDCFTRAHYLSKNEIQFAIIFDYALKYILQIDVSLEPIEIYRDLLNKKYTKDIRKIISAIKKYLSDNDCKNSGDVLKYLTERANYSSVLGFFCRELAKRLNGDKKSIEYMKSIISAKNFWQANLNQNAWRKGRVEYILENSSNLELKITGDKSGYNDLKGSQGKINYVLI